MKWGRPEIPDVPKAAAIPWRKNVGSLKHGLRKSMWHIFETSNETAAIPRRINVGSLKHGLRKSMWHIFETSNGDLIFSPQ